MLTDDRLTDVASTLLATRALQLTSLRPLQTLWAGYGQICAVDASRPGDEKNTPLILKYVSPPPVKPGRLQDEGHIRKVISYQVEQYFYTYLAPLLPDDVAVATCLASVDSCEAAEKNVPTTTTAMILTDLREAFPVAGEKRGALNKTQLYAAIDWLASFHGFWWKRQEEMFQPNDLRLPPLEEARRAQRVDGQAELPSKGVWLNGGYTYLATRRKEFDDLAQDDTSEWQELCRPLSTNGENIAERVARFLSPDPSDSSPLSKYKTLIHGDVKSENLFTTTEGREVAFYDFQYVGLGLGVCDLAKLFTCSASLDMLTADVDSGELGDGEEKLLRRYLKRLTEVSGKGYEWSIFLKHWQTGVVDWLRFQASWGFWGNTDWLNARARTILQDEDWMSWLEANTRT